MKKNQKRKKTELGCDLYMICIWCKFFILVKEKYQDYKKINGEMNNHLWNKIQIKASLDLQLLVKTTVTATTSGKLPRNLHIQYVRWQGFGVRNMALQQFYSLGPNFLIPLLDIHKIEEIIPTSGVCQD